MVANCGHGYCYFGLRYRFWFCWLSQPLIAFYPRMRTEGRDEEIVTGTVLHETLRLKINELILAQRR